MNDWFEEAMQLQADIPEIANELRQAVKEHHQSVGDRNDPSWSRLMRAIANFVLVNNRIAKVQTAALAERDAEIKVLRGE